MDIRVKPQGINYFYKRISIVFAVQNVKCNCSLGIDIRYQCQFINQSGCLHLFLLLTLTCEGHIQVNTPCPKNAPSIFSKRFFQVLQMV